MANIPAGSIRAARGPAGTIEVNSVTQGAPGSVPIITNVGSMTHAKLDFTIPTGKPFTLVGQVSTYSQLPTNLTANDAGNWYYVQDDGLLYEWNGTTFPASGSGIPWRGPVQTGPTVDFWQVDTPLSFGYPGSADSFSASDFVSLWGLHSSPQLGDLLCDDNGTLAFVFYIQSNGDRITRTISWGGSGTTGITGTITNVTSV